LVAWKAFVDVCRNAGGKKLNIVETAYLPIPFIIEDTTQSTHIVVSTASTTRTFTRESLLKKYDNVIKKSKKSPIFSQVVD
ncbi:phage repressor protein, partial [Escherichia coli]|nr:phage repressor protein [Escherichia coli]